MKKEFTSTTSYLPSLTRDLEERKISRREFVRTTTLLGLSAGTAYALAGSAIPENAFAQSAMPKGGTLRINTRLDQLQSNPHALQTLFNANVFRGSLDYLTETGVDNITRPSLLEKWSVSPDLRTWTLSLRKDVKWRKGRRFTAEDVVWNFKHVLDPKNGSSTIGLMRGYLMKEEERDGKKVSVVWDSNAFERVDDYTVRLNLKTPQLAVPEHLFHYAFPIIDPEEDGRLAPGMNGTGAFEVVEYEVRRKAVLQKRGEYWGEGPYLDKVEFVDLSDDVNGQIAALASRQIDGLTDGQVAQYETLKRMDFLQEYTSDTSLTFIVRGKVDQKPHSDPKVRLALKLASDQEKTTELCRRQFGLAAEHTHVGPMHPDYAKLPPFARDVERAKKLLAEAGYPDGLDLEMIAPRDVDWNVTAAQALAEQWKEAGIRVKLNILPGTAFWENWTKHTFSITRWAHRPLGVMNLAFAYRSGVPWNESGYSNPKFDEILNRAESTVDIAERRKVMAELEKIMQEDGPVVQTTWAKLFTFMNKRVKGFTMHPSSYIFSNRLAVTS